MQESDEAYFARRMHAERIRVLSAACQASREAHQTLALLYARKWKAMQPVTVQTDRRSALT
jgi:hypothetical protein